MKIVHYYFSLLLILIFSSCNYFPKGTGDIIIDSYKIYNHNASSSTMFHYLDLTDQSTKHLVSESEAYDEPEKAFVRTVVKRASKVNEDSLLLLTIDFDNYIILSDSTFHKSDLDKVIIRYNQMYNVKSEPTKEDLELKAAENEVIFWRRLKILTAFILGIVIVCILPKVIKFIVIITRRDRIKCELDRLRKVDEREVKSRIVSDLKAKGYDEKIIKDVYDQFIKEHK